MDANTFLHSDVLPLATHVSRLKNRQDFLRARSGINARSHLFLIESCKRADADDGAGGLTARLGLTVTRRNGNAVVRNRIKRRLSEAARIGLPGVLLAGYDYVIVARSPCLHIAFEELLTGLKTQILKCNNRYSKAAILNSKTM